MTKQIKVEYDNEKNLYKIALVVSDKFNTVLAHAAFFGEAMVKAFTFAQEHECGVSASGEV